MTTRKPQPKTRTKVVYKYHPRPDAYDKSWHLDKKVPIALIFALAVQAIGAIMWGTTMHNNQLAMARQLTVIEEKISEGHTKGAVVDDQMRGILYSVERLATSIKVIAEALRARANDGMSKADLEIFCARAESLNTGWRCPGARASTTTSPNRDLQQSADEALRTIETLPAPRSTIDSR